MQYTRRGALREPLEHTLHPRWVLLHVVVDRQHIVPDSSARLPHPHSAPRAALANFLKGAALAQQRRRRRDEVKRQAVEHHGQAVAAKQVRSAACKCRAIAGRAQRDRIGTAQDRAKVVHQPMLVWLASGCMDDAAEPVRVLDRHQSHAARRGVDQRRLPTAQLRAVQRGVHRAPRDRQRARRLKGERGRLGREPCGGAARSAREAGDAQPEYNRAGAKVGGTATYLQNDTRAFASRRAGVAWSQRVGRRVGRHGDPASQYLQPVVGASATSSSISESPSGAPNSGWASSFRLAIAPRDGSRSCKRPWRANGTGARRGTRARSGFTHRATSGSTPAHALSARSAARGSVACRTERRTRGASCRTQRARPNRPACGAWRGASPLRTAERSTSRAAGAVAMCMITHSAVCSIGSGSRPRRDAARRTSTPFVPPTSMGAVDDGSTGSAPSSNTDLPLSLPAGVASSHRV
eukprot:scaffold106528_cov66-Phaeocystis_antarctica.AAC.1